jgi:hypothetical protein
MQEMPVFQVFAPIHDVRFTVPVGPAITIAGRDVRSSQDAPMLTSHPFDNSVVMPGLAKVGRRAGAGDANRRRQDQDLRWR